MSVLTLLGALALALPVASPSSPTLPNATADAARSATSRVASDGILPKLRLPRRKKNAAENHPVAATERRLRLLVAQQEAWHSAHGRYTTDVVRAARADAVTDAAMDMVQVQVLYASRAGWTALASHPAAPGRSCVVFVGTRERLPLVPRTRLQANEAHDEGRPVCDAR